MATITTALVVRMADSQSPKLSKENIDIPRPAENQVLIKISHAAQSPTDSMFQSSHDCCLLMMPVQDNPLTAERSVTAPFLGATIWARS
jgi:NADPH:quinone reductase-like Zn-dependent oxidoreductase